jgi:ParB-like chromosome segregation protein Spo0J
MELEIKVISIDDLTLDPDNARAHNQKNLDAIAKSLQMFGQRKPVVITKELVVVAGNGTLEAAKQIGWKGLSCVTVPDDWDTDTIKAYALADNRTAELASWNTEVLLGQLRDLDSSDWSVTDLGFKGFDLKTRDEIDTDLKEIGERFEVVIECDDENDQTALLLRLSQEGLRVRAIVI